MVSKVFHDKLAQTDISKEMWVPNTIGFKHLTIVIYLLTLNKLYLNNSAGPGLVFKNSSNIGLVSKLDGVGPIDNRPTSDYLYHKKKKKEKKVLLDT